MKETKNRTGIPVSVKIRIHDDLSETLELARRVEKVGAAWLSVHGRTPQERREPVHYDAIKLIKDSIGIPVVANGDIFTDEDAQRVVQQTGADGVMSARGLLANPALFEGHEFTPRSVVQEYVDLALKQGSTFHCFHHHLIYMLDAQLSKAGRWPPFLVYDVMLTA